MKKNILDWIAVILVIIGGINWGLVGFFQVEMGGMIFGSMNELGSRIVYSLVGLASLYMIYFAIKK